MRNVSPHLSRLRWTLAVPLLAVPLAAWLAVGHRNVDVFRLLQQIDRALPDDGWWLLTWLGDAQFTLALLAIAALPHAPRWLMAMLWGALPTTLFVHGLKWAVHAERPISVLGPEGVHVVGAALRHGSFPSGHTATAFLAAGCVVLCLSAMRQRRWALPIIAVAALVGLSRVAVGAHWPLDVLVGAAGGWGCAALGVWAANRWSAGQSGRGLRVLGALAVVLGVSLWLRPLAEPEIWLARLLGAGALIAGGVTWHRPPSRETAM